MPDPSRNKPRASERPVPGIARTLLRRAEDAAEARLFDRAAELLAQAHARAPWWPAPLHVTFDVGFFAGANHEQRFRRQVCVPALEELASRGQLSPLEAYVLGGEYGARGDDVGALALFQAAFQHEDVLRTFVPEAKLKDNRAWMREMEGRLRKGWQPPTPTRRDRPARPAPTEGGAASAAQPRGKGKPSLARGRRAAPPAASPQPEAPPPVPLLELPPALLTPPRLPALDRTREALAAGGSDLAGVRLCLDAHEVALAERYDELLCLRTLSGVEEHAYQVETVRRVLRVFRGRALLADEVGLGKTIEAGMVLKEFLLRGMVRSALILVPPALVSQWRDELHDKFGIDALTTEQAAFSRDPAGGWAAPGVRVASIALARNARHQEWVRGRAWDMVIVDEAHHAKSRGTATWKLLDGLCSRFLVMLTATPIENDLEELYNLITLLRPGHLGTRTGFRARFATPGDACTPRDPEALRALLTDVMIRNTRATADVRLPPRFATTIRVEPTALERRTHEQLNALLRRWYDHARERLFLGLLLQEACSSSRALRRTLESSRGQHPEALTQELSALLAELTNAPETAPPGDDASAATGARPGKEDQLIRFLHESGEQALVFTRYRATAEGLEACLRGAGIPCASFHGAMTPAQKDQAVDTMRQGLARALIATQVGGEGRNMQFLRVLVNYDLPWNPMEIEQRIGRVHRIGQQRDVLILNLAQKESVEDRILTVLDQKINLFELVVGELDLVLGPIGEGSDFEQRVLEILGRSRDDADLSARFDALGDELESGRRRYDRVKALDAQLFADDYGA